MGPLLFILYLYDISSVLKYCSFYQYADDLQIYIAFDVKSFLLALSKVNEDLMNLVNYILRHNLTINVSKTQPIIIGTGKFLNVLAEGDIPQIVLNNQSIPYLAAVQNLGVMMDNTLWWNQQSVNTINRVFQDLSQIRRNFSFMPPNIRLRVITSLIQPLFDYGAILFTDIPQTTNIKLQRAQNACVRFGVGARKSEHITPYYNQLNMLKLEDRRILPVKPELYTSPHTATKCELEAFELIWPV